MARKGGAGNAPARVILAQVTDTHVKLPGKLAYGRVDTRGFLERAVAAMNALDPQPELIALTGDLVDGGTVEEYVQLRSLLAPLRARYILLPGNHDDREAMRAGFPDHDYLGKSGYIQYAMDLGPLRLIGLDTLVPGHGHGELCNERLAWLEKTLKESPRPTVVMMHHPPFITGIGHMDRLALNGRDEFAAVMLRHPQVQRVICGHLHRSIQCRVGNTVASTCPASCHQVALELEPGKRGEFIFEPPGYQLHCWIEGTGLVTHTAVIGDYDGPYPFRDS
jgi:3',5'-cyclic-AMP phosphodiesterase